MAINITATVLQKFLKISRWFIGLPRWLRGKESICNARDSGLIPDSRRSPGGGHGNPLQYSYLDNPTDRGAWQATVYRVTKSQITLKWLNMHAACTDDLLNHKVIIYLYTEYLYGPILEWIAIPFCRESSQPRDGTWVSCIAGGFFTVWATKEVLLNYKIMVYLYTEYLYGPSHTFY